MIIMNEWRLRENNICSNYLGMEPITFFRTEEITMFSISMPAFLTSRTFDCGT
jgi:hypothetical protein